MGLAIAEARKGAGFVAPNPLVGAVILDSQYRFLASGYHARCGEAHAEIEALAKVKKTDLNGAHFFITLEPCAHVGRTPSCAKTLSHLPLASVTYGVEDPHPLVSGRGAEIIREAGIQAIHKKEFEADCRELAEVFFVNQLNKRPFVALKVATSLDGFMALKSGESQWITGQEARTYGHYLRAIYDATLVGAGTFIADNPSLNIRHPNYEGKSNKVIIIDKRGNLLSQLPGTNVDKCHKAKDIILVTCGFKELKNESPYSILCLDKNIDENIPEVLTQLFDLGVTSLLIEGGAKTYSLFLNQGLVDRVYIFMAPSIIGAVNGMSWTHQFKTSKLSEMLRLENPSLTPLGSDYLYSARPKFK